MLTLIFATYSTLVIKVVWNLSQLRIRRILSLHLSPEVIELIYNLATFLDLTWIKIGFAQFSHLQMLSLNNIFEPFVYTQDTESYLILQAQSHPVNLIVPF